MTNDVDWGYGSSYENSLILRGSRGIVIELLQLAAAEFETYKHRKLQSFKETKKIAEEFKN